MECPVRLGLPWIFAKLTSLDLGFWAGSGRSWQAWWILVGPNQAKLVEASSQFRHREDPRSRIQNLQVHPAKTVGRRGTLTTRAGSWILDLRLLPNIVSFHQILRCLPDLGSWILGMLAKDGRSRPFLSHGNPGSRTQKRVEKDGGGATLNLRGRLHQVHENPESRIQDRR